MQEDSSEQADSKVSEVIVQQNAAALKDIKDMVSEYLHTRMEILSEKVCTL
jgi:hypothetical protein